MIAITNGRIIKPNEIILGHDILIEDNIIKDIIKTEDRINYENIDKVIDANNGDITPGFIDIHADYIEHITAPRPSSLMDFKLALREAERELVTHGITTMYHSLSLYRGVQVDDKPIRRQENVRKFIDLISNTNNGKHLIRHRLHARYEIDNIHGVDEIIDNIKEKRIDMLSFMDHTPGQGQFSDKDAYKRMAKQYGSKMNEEEFETFFKDALEAPKLSFDDCRKIAEIAIEHNVAIASHDDDSVEKINSNMEMGIKISEFPIKIEVAEYAHKNGLATIAGAPNVLLGGSHSGNLAAYKAIEKKVIDILCSDYYPAAMLHSIYKLHNEYGHSLNEMVNLVTLNPAKAVNIDNEVGAIEIGKKADLLIIEKIDDNFPVITNVFVDGKSVFEMRY